MSTTAVILILLSAVMHAAWNLLARRSRSEVGFLRRMLVAGSVLGLAPALVLEIREPLPVMAFVYVAASGACCGIYFLGLAKSYARSDFTTVYPVVRGLPVLIIALVDLSVG